MKIRMELEVGERIKFRRKLLECVSNDGKCYDCFLYQYEEIKCSEMFPCKDYIRSDRKNVCLRLVKDDDKKTEEE